MSGDRLDIRVCMFACVWMQACILVHIYVHACMRVVIGMSIHAQELTCTSLRTYVSADVCCVRVRMGMRRQDAGRHFCGYALGQLIYV